MSAAMTRRFDLIVFDWDGTLFDSTRLIARCIQAACADVGTSVPNDRDASFVIGLGLADALRLAAPELAQERYGDLAERDRHHYLSSQDDIVLFEGTLEMLRDAQAAQPQPRGGHRQDPTGPRRCAAPIGARRLPRCHPHRRRDREQARPAYAARADARAGCAAERTLMIGDTTHDLQLADNAGCASVAVSFGAHGHEEFARHRPLHVADSTADLAGGLVRHA